MATWSLDQPRRRKPTTYGKASRGASSWSASNFYDEDQTTRIKPVEPTKADEKIQSVQRRVVEPNALQTIKPKGIKSKDSWDVPSSDDEAELSPIRRTSPPKLPAQRKLAKIAKASETVLAPWEKSKASETRSQDGGFIRKAKAVAASPDVQLTAELELCAQKQEALGSSTNIMENDNPRQTLPLEEAGSELTTAAARLRAKRSKAEHARSAVGTGGSMPVLRASKRTNGPFEDGIVPTPRKRLRPGSTLLGNVDIRMRDATVVPTCDHIPATQFQENTEGTDVYDVPANNSTDESVNRRDIQGKHVNSLLRRGKITRYSSPRKMESAPARLNDMLPSDTDTSNTITREPSVTRSRPSTPLRATIWNATTTPETAIKSSGMLIPKQAELWEQLLPRETVAPSPSMLLMEGLTLKSRQKPTTACPGTLNKSSSDVGQRRRTKLVDRLKASQPSAEDEMTDDSDEESESESDCLSADYATRNSDDSVVASQSQSQSQSQGVTGPKNSLKVTYGSQPRSYLPEDSFEDNLMLDLHSDAPQRSKMSTMRASQKSVFDLEESDDEGAGRLRSIHELRAGGGNQRFKDDIGGLLEDIKDHNASGRSRRRSGLIDLAGRLGDEAFAERFFRQSFEQNLVAECSAAPDDIADFALAGAFATMMSREQPEHVARSLKDGGVFAWLARLLDNRTDSRETAQERRNNMSKSAQANFASFVETLTGRDALWGQWKPRGLTPRIIALKACDGIVGKLRRTGDTAELMEASEIRQIIPNESEIAGVADETAVQHITLAVSTLESLSTAALSLNWPTHVTEQLRELLISRHPSGPQSDHLVFLLLRLLTNLTNGNSRNCKAFSQPAVVIHILRMIAEGFGKLYAEVDEAQRTINLDVLVLSTGILINITEYNESAREHTTTEEAQPILAKLVAIFQRGQRRMLDAESEEQGVTNVVYGYLAVMLANLCRNNEAKDVISSRLPHHRLAILVEALEEFVAHHQRVDTQNFEGEEGAATWSAHTDRLLGVLVRLKAVA